MQHNRNKAFPLFKSAALNGEVDAFNGVGLCYDSGIGIPANTELAVANYRKGRYSLLPLLSLSELISH